VPLEFLYMLPTVAELRIQPRRVAVAPAFPHEVDALLFTWLNLANSGAARAAAHGKQERRKMLQLHQGLVLSVALYALPLLSLNTSQAANLETVHRIALRICLGISRSAASIPTYTEAGANTVSNHLQKRALGHLIRISTCESAAPLLARIAERPESRLGQLLCVLGDVAGPAPAITPLPPLHSDPHPLTVHLRVDGMGPRRRTADVVAKQLTEDHIERHHPGWARVYTDGSVRPSDGSSTAAVFVERADLGVGERFAFHATSTTTELAAILLALRLIHYKSRRPDSWLLLSDSQAALSQLFSNFRLYKLLRACQKGLCDQASQAARLASHRRTSPGRRMRSAARERASLVATFGTTPHEFHN
ncbi:uncharacterized protein ISCGN_025574, partial [Ixodes scapularis]